MKNISNPKDFNEIATRLNKLQPETKAKWGKMNAGQMLCHASDPIRGALGLREYKNIGNYFYYTIPKWLFLYVTPFTKNLPTGPEFNQLFGTGTPVTDFKTDRETLLRLVKQLHEEESNATLTAHPLFGKMSKWEWGRMTWQHLDHHLRQFGV